MSLPILQKCEEIINTYELHANKEYILDKTDK